MTSADNYTIYKHPDMRWGAFYQPLKPRPAASKGLRIVLFASCECGIMLLEHLALLEKKFPGTIHLTGIATDDPVDAAARISLKKRVWSQFSAEERRSVFDRMVKTATDMGLPVYSGAVKTDYFREIYRQWNPDALLMFCFGQKIDAVLYDSPPAGAYNFHPSSLHKQIGAGSQPFHKAIENGQKSSQMVIHKVTEQIDVGPIVGISPEVNICLADGSYPVSVRSLLDKITSTGGWMGVELVQTLSSINNGNHASQIDFIDFEGLMPPEVKHTLAQAAVNDLNEKYTLALHPLIQS